MFEKRFRLTGDVFSNADVNLYKSLSVLNRSCAQPEKKPPEPVIWMRGLIQL